MFEYDDEAEFENAWDKMIQKYNVGSISWLDGIYKLKTKWARCHMKNESLNSDLKAYLKSNLTFQTNKKKNQI